MIEATLLAALLCIGDSNTIAFTGMEPPVNWCERVGGTVCARGGLRATTSEAWTEDCLDTHEPDRVIFHLGTNDIFHQTPTAVIVAAMQDRVAQASAHGAESVVTSLLDTDPPSAAALNNGYAVAFRAAYLPILDDLESEDFAPDGFHINESGHAKVADAVEAYLERRTLPALSWPMQALLVCAIAAVGAYYERRGHD